MLKVLHGADFHLDSPFPGGGASSGSCWPG